MSREPGEKPVKSSAQIKPKTLVWKARSFLNTTPTLLLKVQFDRIEFKYVADFGDLEKGGEDTTSIYDE